MLVVLSISIEIKMRTKHMSQVQTKRAKLFEWIDILVFFF